VRKPTATPNFNRTTSVLLLEKIKRWDDREAWEEFFSRYHPMLVRWTEAQVRDRSDAAELVQLIWFDLIRRIRNFSYNPQYSFRGWLRRVHRNRMLDFFKVHQRYERHLKSFAFQHQDDLLRSAAPPTVKSSSHPSAKSECRVQELDRLIDIQAEVKRRVSEKSWTIFWQVTIEGRPLSDVAKEHSMKYGSAFAAYSRVTKMLRKEAFRQ
jgi:RNA polymerase sigma factor (sigma-70 family)